MSEDKRQGMRQAGEERSEERAASKVGGSESAQPTEQPQPQSAQHKGRGGARPGAGRKAKWGEKTVVMRVPVSMRGAVEEFLAGKASAAGQDASRPEGVEAQVEQTVAEVPAVAAAVWDEECVSTAAAQQTRLAEATAAWECERASLEAQLEELRAQLVLAEGQRQALAAEAERLRQKSGAAQAVGCEGSPGPASVATDAAATFDSASSAALSQGLASNVAVPAADPVAVAGPAPKPKKPRAPRKKKAQDKAGAVDPSQQMSLFDLLGDD